MSVGQRSRYLYLVQLGDVAIEQLLPVVSIKMTHITRDHIPRVGPGRILMRVVVGPHEVIAAPP